MKRPLVLLVVVTLLGACASSRYERRPQSGMMVASWYGKEFHGKPTASGEIFDMYAYTAAHRSLSFGTRLRITNPENGRSVIVKINDRGPFVQGRDIDLSYIAARDLGIIQKGTARVFVDYVGRDRGYVRPARYLAASGPFTIQIASFTDIRNAFRLKTALRYSYNDVYISKARVEGKRYYRVRLGRFSDRNDAEELVRRLSEEGYHVVVLRYEETL